MRRHLNQLQTSREKSPLFVGLLPEISCEATIWRFRQAVAIVDPLAQSAGSYPL
jgi:hypothetical protein